MGVESGNDVAVLVCNHNLGCRNLGVTAGKMTLGSKYVTKFGRYVIIYGGVYGKSHVLTLIYKGGKYEIGQCKQCPTLTDVACIHMVLCYGHCGLGSTGFDLSKLNTYVFGELVTIVQKILECHD